jgi:SWI/SNF-related matrix-associated actin-dependent regulator 1 of chromatin subfamily A
MTIPFPYQERGIKKIERFGGRCLLADEMGLGKSAQVLWWAKRFLPRGPIVIVCPASIKWNWEREVKKHVKMRTRILEGTRPPAHFAPRKDTIYILNFDILGSWMDHLEALEPQLVIADECHYVKNQKAKRTKYLRRLAREAPHFVAISGTPMTNRPAELWPVLNMIDPEQWPSFFPFGNRYCKPEHTPWGIKYNGAERLDELHKLLRETCMIRRKKSQVLKDLPPKTVDLVPIQLKAADKKTYHTIEHEFIKWLRATQPNRANKARKNERQSKFGYLKRMIGRLKMAPVKEWIDSFLEESDGKLIAFGWHRKVMEQYHEMYQRQSVMVNGSVKGRERQRRIDQFTLKKRTRIFFGNIAAAGVGWNGTVASTVIFAEFGWTPGEHSQAIDRAHRIGQKMPVNAHFLYVPGTIEEHLVKTINKKQGYLDEALDGGKTEGSLDLVYDVLENAMLERSRR